MSTGDNKAERRVSAREIAKHFGREVRVVQLWFKRGCPHTREKVGKIERLYAKPVEVASWLSGQGLDLQKDQPAANVIAASAAGPLFDAGRKEREEEITALEGPLNYSRMIAGFLRQIQDIDAAMGNALVPDGAGGMRALQPGEIDRLAGAKKRLNEEVRHLEKLRSEAEERSGRLMERSKAAQAQQSLAELLVANLEALKTDAVREVMGKLEGMVPAARADEARRVCEQAMDAAVMGLRARVFETVTRTIGAA